MFARFKSFVLLGSDTSLKAGPFYIVATSERFVGYQRVVMMRLSGSIRPKKADGQTTWYVH
jgi:hypothetical protein